MSGQQGAQSYVGAQVTPRAESETRTMFRSQDLAADQTARNSRLQPDTGKNAQMNSAQVIWSQHAKSGVLTGPGSNAALSALFSPKPKSVLRAGATNPTIMSGAALRMRSDVMLAKEGEGGGDTAEEPPTSSRSTPPPARGANPTPGNSRPSGGSKERGKDRCAIM